MKVLFWLALAAIVHAYVGYAVLLAAIAHLRPRPVRPRSGSSENSPTVSIIIAARNEALNLVGKLHDIYNLHYAADRLQIVIASDGSTDNTATLLSAHSARVTAVLLPASLGKASALNAAVHAATGDILVFLDARQRLDREAVAHLVGPFDDPEVGAVSGELLLETAAGQPSSEALGIYWKIEKTVRRLESATGSVVGVTGAIYAMRRELYDPIPGGTLLDDVLIPMMVARRGYRVLFHSAAIARDTLFADRGKEFSRKVRTLTGNYQLLKLAPWLLSPANPLLLRVLQHKLLRLAVPVLLLLLLLTSALATGPVYHAAFWLQVLLYTLAGTGLVLPGLKRHKAVAIPYTFVLLNVAAALAFYNFVTGRARWA